MGVLGLALAIIGVYGVVSYQTRQREKEIGIRVALGAIPADVRRLVLSQGAWLVGVGAVLGVLLALVATLALRRMLVLVSVTDPLTFVGVTAALSASALAACYLPARRATRVEPVTVLRQE
jgi:putative ABC transport system permease protein